MAKSKKISDAEAEVIKDAIIVALNNNDEAGPNVAPDVALEELATEVALEEVATEEVTLNVPAPEREDPGHHSRDFSA